MGLPQIRKAIACYLTQPVVRFLMRTPITPNALTWSGILVTAVAVGLIITGHLFAAGFVVLAAGFFDILDGALARSSNRTTRFGAVLDSTLDRAAEAALLLGIMIFYLLNTSERSFVVVLLANVTMICSFLVSYIRAKAETIGVDCEVGLFTRTERVIVLALGLLLNRIDYALIVALAIIAFFSFVTVNQRLLRVWRQTKNPGSS